MAIERLFNSIQQDLITEASKISGERDNLKRMGDFEEAAKKADELRLALKKVKALDRILQKTIKTLQNSGIEQPPGEYLNKIIGERDPSENIILQQVEHIKNTKAEITEEELVPSKELSWMLGFLSGRGHTEISAGHIALQDRNNDLLRTFQLIGERLFGINMSSSSSVKEPQIRTALFSSQKIVNLIGNLNTDCWPQTIVNNHNWLFSKNEYQWGFIEGLFDAKGLIEYESKGNRKRRWQISFYTNFPNIANFIGELLARLSIENPQIYEPSKPSGRSPRTTIRVFIRKSSDLKYFADNVHSKIPEKEEKLAHLRQRIKKARNLPQFNVLPGR